MSKGCTFPFAFFFISVTTHSHLLEDTLTTAWNIISALSCFVIKCNHTCSDEPNNSMSHFHCKNYSPYSTVSCNQVRSGYPSWSTKQSYQPRCSIDSSSNNSKQSPAHYVLHMNGHDHYIINFYFLHILFK